MKNPSYRHYYLRIEKMKKNQLCYFFLIWMLGLEKIQKNNKKKFFF